MAELCRLLDWDSEHFGVSIARILPQALTKAQYEEADRWCRQRKVRCVYFLCSSEARESIRLASSFGFECVDIRVEFERKNVCDSIEGQAQQIRVARAEDVPFLKEIARSSHYHTRFYADPRFAREACDRLYEIWIEKSCQNPSECVWTAEDPAGRPVGYVTGSVEPDRVGRIGLLAVREDLRGQGWGSALVLRIIRWFVEAGVESIRVATQAANVPALRLYSRLGFQPVKVGLWFHKWY